MYPWQFFHGKHDDQIVGPHLAGTSFTLSAMGSPMGAIEVRHLVRADPFSANGPHLAAKEGRGKGPGRWDAAGFGHLQGPLIEEFEVAIMVAMAMAIGNR